ncbi:Uncharacterized zinc protease RP219 [Candidatus Xenohaliotis californiensis]|uniref:Uncharacterized zinc protease RP219 n=1 Tax=Candidatus Xenohaliotis californiensis TaxID=84677 RepID=A0ABP0ETM6_9RICK|nr:Uncharacterized zinc protease RP219 [Candidatus Xenohaliotis californiensis]
MPSTQHPEPLVFTLSNGIKLIVDAIDGIESIAVSIWIKVGSRFEEKSQSGLSHFLEHMAFKGTKLQNAKQLAIAFDNVGAYFNACTARDYTSYYAKAMKEDLPMIVKNLADILINSTFPKDEIEKEREVILQEISRTNDTPDDLIFDKYMEVCYPNQPLGLSILGDKKFVASFTQDDLFSYFRKHYTADNTIISVAGNCTDPEKICNLFEENFANMPISEGIKNPRHISAQYQKNFSIDRRNLEQVQLIFSTQSTNNCSSSGNIRPYIAANLYSAILGGGMSSRLFQSIRENLGLAYAVSSYTSAYNDVGLFSIYAGVSPENVKHLIQEILLEIKKSSTIDNSELERAKKQYTVPLRTLREDCLVISRKNGRNFMIYNKVFDIQEIINIVNNTTISEIQNVASNIIDASKDASIAAIGNISEMINDKWLFEKINSIMY